MLRDGAFHAAYAGSIFTIGIAGYTHFRPKILQPTPIKCRKQQAYAGAPIYVMPSIHAKFNTNPAGQS